MRRTGCTSTDGPGSALLTPILLLSLLACGTASEGTADRDVIPTTALEAAATEILDASAESWNAGDLEGFISHYHGDATFAGSRGLIRGAEAVRQLYADGYWASGAPEDALSFEVLHARGTAPASGVVFGRYTLADRSTDDISGTGYFSLVLQRLDGAWKIVHDHSSAAESPPD